MAEDIQGELKDVNLIYFTIPFYFFTFSKCVKNDVYTILIKLNNNKTDFLSTIR